jgi:hypothetical protein
MGFKWWGDELIGDGWVSAAGFRFILGAPGFSFTV